MDYGDQPRGRDGPAIADEASFETFGSSRPATGSIAQGFQASVYSLLTCRQHRSSPHGFERATQA